VRLNLSFTFPEYFIKHALNSNKKYTQPIHLTTYYLKLAVKK